MTGITVRDRANSVPAPQRFLALRLVKAKTSNGWACWWVEVTAGTVEEAVNRLLVVVLEERFAEAVG